MNSPTKQSYNLNSGVSLYFSNSTTHSDCDKGGRMPVMGRHSVILKPDWVRRVTPPTKMTAKTRAEDASSHLPTDGRDSTGRSAMGGGELLAEKNRASRFRG